MRASARAALALGVWAAAAAPARAASPAPCAACVWWELDADAARPLLDRPEPLAGLDLLLRGEAPGLAAALSARGARVGRAQGVDRPLAKGDAAALDVLLLDVEGAAGDPAAAALRVKVLGTELRAQAPRALVGLDAPEATLAALWAHGVAPYVDFVVGAPGAPSGIARWGRIAAGETLTLERTLEATRVADIERLIAPWPSDPRVPAGLRLLRGSLPAGLSPLPQVVVSCERAAAPGEGSCTSEVFLHPVTLDAVALVRPRRPVRTVWVRPGATAAWWQPLAEDPAAREAQVAIASDAVRLDLPEAHGPLVIRIAGWAGEGGRFAAGLDVLDEKILTVAEVIARHQAAAARQRQRVRRYVAQGATVIAFQAPGLAAPVTVTADTVLYASGEAVEIEQRALRVNGVAVGVGRDGVPRLPIVEPERVSQAPMAITLDEAYEYRLQGRERVDGEDAYVVAFTPRDTSRPRLRGQAWIAARGFALLRVHAVQTGLRGGIVSSEQRDEFAPVPAGGETAWLLARSQVDQVYEGAGHRTPIQRVLTLAGHEADPADFDERLRAAHASDSVMLRDTPEGYRYLRRAASAEAKGGALPEDRAARTVTTRGRSRVRTLALGAMVDPNISTPLPFGGLSYLDFDFLGTGAQVNAFFAAAFLQAAVAVPSLGGSRWQLHGSAFATLAEYNDRVFRDGVERYDENLKQRPARLGVALVRPLSARLMVRAGYELGYTRLRRSDLTAPDFAAPPSPLVHALRLSLEGQRGPWAASLWWSPARRQQWRAWGRPGGGEEAPAHADFERFGATLGRSFVLSPATLVRIDTAWMAGTDLDRFSRFTFDGFDSRLRGYPSAGLRFDGGAVVRTVAAWTVAPAVRLDLFADTALVHDPNRGPGLHGYTGIGAGLEAPLPWRTLLAAEWGYGFQGRDRDGGRGTHVFRITAYKVF